MNDAAPEAVPEVAAWEDGFRTDPSPGRYEWWYFDAHLDDGSVLVVNLLTRPLARWRGALRPKVELTLTRPDGTTVREFLFPDPESFAASANDCDVRMGDTSVRGDLRHYVLHVEGERVIADLELDATVPPWRPGDGLVFFDDAHTSYLGWLVAVPHGTVRGTLSVDGVSAPANGEAYHDHNWGNAPLARVMSSWLWGRAHVGPWTVLFFRGHGLGGDEDAVLPLFALARDDEWVLTGPAALDLEATGELPRARGPELPERVTLIARDHGRVARVELSDPVPLERESLLATVPIPARWLAKAFVDPWYVRLDAALTLRIDEGEVREVATGRAVYEWMIFRGELPPER